MFFTTKKKKYWINGRVVIIAIADLYAKSPAWGLYYNFQSGIKIFFSIDRGSKSSPDGCGAICRAPIPYLVLVLPNNQAHRHTHYHGKPSHLRSRHAGAMVQSFFFQPGQRDEFSPLSGQKQQKIR